MYELVGKRAFDIVISAMMLILLSPIMLLTAIAIKIDSSGPIIFKQIRHTKNSAKFVLYKFRSMAKGSPIKANSDFTDIQVHLTAVGALIRRTSIDELPQLWNVLRGDISLIGPRALADTDKDVLRLRQKNGATRVKAGITGLAQVNGRNKMTDKRKAAYDGEYAKHVTFKNDMKIISYTFLIVIKQEGIFKNE